MRPAQVAVRCRGPVLAVLLVGCTGGGAPRDGRLEGIWVSTDTAQGVHRGLEIAELDPPVGGVDLQYSLYLYAIGDAPEPVQSGLFSVVDGEVLWDVRWDVNPLSVGIRYADPLDSLTRDELVIAGRTWLAADALIPGDTTVPVFGQAWWAVPAGGGLGTGLWVDDVGVGAGTSAITGDVITLVGLDGRDPVSVRLPRTQNGQFARITGIDGDVGYSEGLSMVRAHPTLIPGDAFTPDQTVIEPVWTADRPCAGLVRAGDRWAGMCPVDGVYGLTWMDPADGSVTAHEPMDTALLGDQLWAVGDDVLVARVGGSPTPELHGDRSEGGARIERWGADGTVRWSRWSPGVPRVEAATLLDDGTTVVVLTSGSEYPGGPTWSDGRAVLQGIGPSGALLWERDLDLDSGFFVGVAPTPAGFAMAVGADDLDVGASVGVVDGERGQALAVVAMDACGQAFDVATWDDCSATCWGQVTPNPSASPLELRRAPDGTLILLANVLGRYDLDGDEVGTSGDGSGLIARLAAPPVAPVCELPASTDPVLTVTVTGPGEVELVGIGTCDGSCTFPVGRFAAVQVSALPDPGAQVDAVQGGCSALPCVLYADGPSLALQVDFALPDATLFGVDGTVRAVGAGSTLGFAAGQLGPGEQAIVDGVTVADGDAGERAWIAALDAQGVVAHAALPGTPSGPYPRRIAVDPASDTAAVLFGGGEIATFGPSGLLTNGPGPGGAQWERIGVDGLGNVAVAGYSGNALAVASADGAWSHTMPTVGITVPVDVLGLPSGGFVVVAPVGGSLEVSPGVTWTGQSYSVVLVHLGADGALLGGGFTMSVTSTSYARAWTDGTSVFLGVDYTQDGSQPAAGAYVERLDLDGTFLDAQPIPHAPMGVWPWSGGFVAVDQTFGTSNPWGGPPLDNRGGVDRAVAWLDGSGALLAAGTTGTAGDDVFDSLFDPVAVQADGVVWLHTPADAVVSTPHALARFLPP